MPQADIETHIGGYAGRWTSARVTDGILPIRSGAFGEDGDCKEHELRKTKQASVMFVGDFMLISAVEYGSALRREIAQPYACAASGTFRFRYRSKPSQVFPSSDLLLILSKYAPDS